MPLNVLHVGESIDQAMPLSNRIARYPELAFQYARTTEATLRLMRSAHSRGGVVLLPTVIPPSGQPADVLNRLDPARSLTRERAIQAGVIRPGQWVAVLNDGSIADDAHVQLEEDLRSGRLAGAVGGGDPDHVVRMLRGLAGDPMEVRRSMTNVLRRLTHDFAARHHLNLE